MKNQNTKWQRLIRFFQRRWSREPYPGGEPRFRPLLLSLDIGTFVLLPLTPFLIYSLLIDGSKRDVRKSEPEKSPYEVRSNDGAKSQIIEFKTGGRAPSDASFPKRSPGSLVRLHLLNAVETYATAPVQAQIVDNGLGTPLRGGIAIGDGTPDSNFERIFISFKYVRDPIREGVALPVSARALSLDGTLGLIASKKEGFFTRSALGSANTTAQGLQGGGSSPTDLSRILLRALSAGLTQEIGSNAQVEKNRSQVLTLPTDVEFFAELTDFFPGAQK